MRANFREVNIDSSGNIKKKQSLIERCRKVKKRLKEWIIRGLTGMVDGSSACLRRENSTEYNHNLIKAHISEMDYLFDGQLLDPEEYSQTPMESLLDLPTPYNQPESSSTIKSRPTAHICKMIESKKASNYYWTDLENNRYMQALKQHAHIFNLTTQERRIKKVNLLLSRKVRTRSPLQCHSHHQKMMAKHASIQKIIIHLELKAEQNRTLWGQGENSKRRGRPPKQPKVKVEASDEGEPIIGRPVNEDDLIFEVLESGRYDLQQQQLERWMEQQSKERTEEDPFIGSFFWL